jgi:hypothetical protein
MKTFLRIILVFSLIFAISCKKETDITSIGKITGPDMRMCACCGGWFINIDNAVYVFDQLPPNSGIDLNTEKFPIAVKVAWRKNTTRCTAGNEAIDIIQIAKIQ